MNDSERKRAYKLWIGHKRASITNLATCSPYLIAEINVADHSLGLFKTRISVLSPIQFGVKNYSIPIGALTLDGVNECV